MTFEESCRNYFDQEYPELAIKRIDTNEIAVYHSELSIGYSILINGKNHNVNSPDDVKRCIDFAAVKWKNKFNTLGTSGYQYKNMVEILIQCGEEPMYRELSSLLEADAAHYFAHDSTETYEIERLSKLEESCPFYHLRQFWIGDIEAKIGKPSDVFRMLMSPYIQYHGMPKESFDKLFSLKLFGVDKQNFMGYISQALFIINQEYSCEQYPSVGGMDDWIAANNQYAQKLYTNGYNHYPEAVPAEPFFLYNAGKTAFSAQESFLYHYRVFEFFLYTLNTSKLIDLLQKYDISSNVKPYNENVIKFMKEIQNNFSNKQERAMIVNAFRSFPYEVESSILYHAKHDGILKVPDSGKEEIAVLADKLYDYRNSIVHSKQEKMDSITFPNPFSDREARSWKLIMEVISHYLVVEYCYNDRDKHKWTFA